MANARLALAVRKALRERKEKEKNEKVLEQEKRENATKQK